MIFRVLALLALPVIAWYLAKSISRRFTLTPRQGRILFFIVTALLVVGVLVALGRLPIHFIIAPLGAAGAFLLRFLPTLLRLAPFWTMVRNRTASAGKRKSDQTSTIRTAWFEMELTHNTGNMDGKVLKGQFTGSMLSSLSLEELFTVYGECREDSDSVQVLEAYLDRSREGWREQTEQDDQRHGGGDASPDDSVMTRALAMEILGLTGEPDRQTIIRAHRSLMQKMHPDRGGSDYLAKKINSAKEFLIEDQAA